MTAVSVRINGEARSVDSRTTLRALLDDLGAARDGVAVALNDEIVLRSSWDATELHDNDTLEVLSAAPGG